MIGTNYVETDYQLPDGGSPLNLNMFSNGPYKPIRSFYVINVTEYLRKSRNRRRNERWLTGNMAEYRHIKTKSWLRDVHIHPKCLRSLWAVRYTLQALVYKLIELLP